MADETVKVKFLNANAEGWATEHDVEKGTLAESFVKQHVGPHYNPDGLKIAVNFKPAVREQVLQDGDFVSATWKNQDGGRLS
jgi:hypothetical protein